MKTHKMHFEAGFGEFVCGLERKEDMFFGQEIPGQYETRYVDSCDWFKCTRIFSTKAQ